MSRRKSVAAGLRFRPLAETIRDGAATLPDLRAMAPPSDGMSRERELDLIEAWRGSARSRPGPGRDPLRT